MKWMVTLEKSAFEQGTRAEIWKTIEVGKR
jgi:hypothetical protein